MRLTILGGTGRIGGHLLGWALEAGHPVHLLARSPEALGADARGLDARGLDARGLDARGLDARGLDAQGSGARDPAARGPAAGLTVTRGDVLDAVAVAEAIAGADAVLSALGPRGARSPGLLAGAAANIVAAMQKTGARRLICVSAAGAFITEDPHAGVLTKLILPRVLAGTFADVRLMENLVRDSDLDWTLVRATRLVNGPLTGRYRVAPDFKPRGGGKISRADVAHFMATALTEDAWPRSAPALAY